MLAHCNKNERQEARLHAREKARERSRDIAKRRQRKKDAPVSASSEFKSPGALTTIVVEVLAADWTTSSAATSAIYDGNLHTYVRIHTFAF